MPIIGPAERRASSGWSIDRSAIAPRLAPLITAVGVSFILQNLALTIAGSGDRAAPQIFPLDWQIPSAGPDLRPLDLHLRPGHGPHARAPDVHPDRTRLGRAMRATAQDQRGVRADGRRLNQTIALTFLSAACSRRAAGVVWGLRFGFVRFDLGFNSGLKAFTAAVLGGIGNITGAALGGFIIGFIENFAARPGLLALVGVPRLHDPDLRPDVQAHRHPRPAVGRSSMSATIAGSTLGHAVTVSPSAPP